MQPLFQSNQRQGYIADLMKQYGDRGKPMSLPNVDHGAYNRGLQFRENEKAHYAAMEKHNKSLMLQLKHTQRHSQMLQGIIDKIEFLDDEEDDSDNHGRGGRHIGGDRGSGALPPQSNPVQDDTHDGATETIISSTQAEVDATVDRRRSSRRDDVVHIEEGASGPTPRRAPPNPPDAAEPDVGGQVGEHGAEE